MTEFTSNFWSLVDNIGKVIYGKRDAVALAAVCLFAEGHVLLEDVPGVGKTVLARSIAASIGAETSRIQFTPDLLPSDVTGTSIYDQRENIFRFHKGPVFAHIVLGDEVNRASPKTQSALLEVMAEQQVTNDLETHELPSPFMVLATQNPIDMVGTYPLPEAQLDRFLMRISLDYPDTDAEVKMLQNLHPRQRQVDISHVLSVADVCAMIETARAIHVAQSMRRYVVGLVAATRSHPEVQLGASPRGSIGLIRSAQVRAAADGRDFIDPDDIKAIALPVLTHRLVLKANAEFEGATAESVIGSVLATQPVPRRPYEG